MNSTIVRPATCVAIGRPCTCEQVHLDAPVLQPLNSYSSLFLVLYGLIRLLKGFRRWQNDSLRIFWNLLLILIGMGSFFFHARLEYWTEVWDFGAIYWVTSVLMMHIYHTASNSRGMTRKNAMIFAVVCALSGMFLKHWFPFLRAIIAGVLLISTIAIVIRYKNKFSADLQKSIRISVIFAGFGMVCFGLDRLDFFCDPSNWFQWHVVWHICLTLSLIQITRVIDQKSSCQY